MSRTRIGLLFVAGRQTKTIQAFGVTGLQSTASTLYDAAGNVLWGRKRTELISRPTLCLIVAHHLDSLTVLDHELGHRLGSEHQATGVMNDTLSAGMRELPI